LRVFSRSYPSVVPVLPCRSLPRSGRFPRSGGAASGLTVYLLFVPEPSWSGHQMSCSLVSDAVEA